LNGEGRFFKETLGVPISPERDQGAAMGTYEELDSVWDEVEDQLTKRGLLVFPSNLLPAEGPQAFWPEGPISDFLDLAEQLGTTLVFASAIRFEPEDVEELAARFDASPSTTSEALIEEAQQRIGNVCEIHVGLTHAGASLIWFSPACWYEDILARADEEADGADVVLSAERSLQEDQWIRTLAANPKFERAKTLEQRLRVAEQVIPELEQMRSHPDPWTRTTQSRVVRAAWDLYVEDIQPEEERGLARKAVTLLESGARKYEVAGRLGISDNKLNRILARYGAG
jgi:hypothetical protein